MVFEYILLALIFIIAGITPELTGFGVATISMSFLPFILPLHIALPLVAIASVFATGIVAFQTRTQKIMKHILPLFIGSLVGVIIGMFFLKSAQEDTLRTMLGVFLISYALFGMFFKGHFLPVNNKKFGGIIGLVAGFFGASFNIHGPLVGLYSTSNDNFSKMQTKDFMATYMFFTGLFTVGGHVISGRVTSEVLWYGLFSMPFPLLTPKYEGQAN